jgi:uncharacterized protein
MFVLLGIGLFHGLFVWSGDILTRFALLGFLLVLYSGLSQRRLIVAAALTYLIVPFALTRLQFLLNLPRGGGGFYLGKAGASILAQGTFSQIAIYRAEDFLVHLRNTALTGGFAGFLTLFILGMWALRAGLLARLAEKKWLWRALATALLTMAVGIHWNAHAREWWPAPTVAPAQRGWRDVNLWLPRAAFYGIGYTLQVWANSAAYLCVLSLVALRARGRTMLAPLAAVGRMPLTTYLMQSVVCTVLFYNFGFGLFGKVTATGMLAISLALFALQILASVYWFRHYRFGPAEWVWRSLTYGESQPMVQTTSATAKTRTAQVLS